MFNSEESAHNTSQYMEYENKAFSLVNSFLPLKQKLLYSYKKKIYSTKNKATEQEFLTFNCPFTLAVFLV